MQPARTRALGLRGLGAWPCPECSPPTELRGLKVPMTGGTRTDARRCGDTRHGRARKTSAFAQRTWLGSCGDHEHAGEAACAPRCRLASQQPGHATFVM